MKLRGDRCVFAGEMQDLGLPLRGEMQEIHGCPCGAKLEGRRDGLPLSGPFQK